MGINGLCKVIEEEAPDVVTTCHLSALNGFYISVDISIFLYKFIRTAGGSGWVNVFISFLCKFIKHNIVTVCIFDGPNPPIEKKLEQLSRRESVAKAVDKLQNLIECRSLVQENYVDDDDVSEDLIARIKSLLFSPVKPDTTNYHSVRSIVDNVSHKIEKLKNQTMSITQEHKDIAFKIVELMGLHAIQADGEAEALCCHLAREGIVHGVLSDDTDCMVYGAPFTFTYKNFTLSDEQVVVYHLDSILNAMGMDHASFIDMCIMLRCDYNRHIFTEGSSSGSGEMTKIRGHMPDKNGNPVIRKPTKKNPDVTDVAVGPKKIIELIKRFKNYDNVEKYITNPEVIRYERCKEIFTTFPPLPFKEMFKRNLQPNIPELESYVTSLDVYANFAIIKSLTAPTPVRVESDSDDDTLSSFTDSEEDAFPDEITVQ